MSKTLRGKNLVGMRFGVIKVLGQTQPPKNTRNKKTLMESVATYQVNQAKWDAARLYCKKHGFEFMLITENELGL